MNITLNKVYERVQNLAESFECRKPLSKSNQGYNLGYVQAIEDVFGQLRAVEQAELEAEKENKENARLASIWWAKSILRANNENL